MESNVTPELAQKVLAADTRNAIKAVGDGGTLGVPHRKLMESLARTPEAAKQARGAALLQKWVEGRDLTDAQRAELREVYPDIISAPDAGPSAESGDEGPRIVGSKVAYPRQLSFYAVLYGLDATNGVRTLKRWIAAGKAAEPMDLPPLHRPEKMPAWYGRRMAHRCPDNILLAAQKAAHDAGAALPAPTSVAADPPAQIELAAMPGLDLEANVEQLRRSLANSERLMEEARAGQMVDGQRIVDQGLVSSRTRDYRETFAEVRKAENDLLLWKEKAGSLAPVAEVRAENNRIAAAIFNALMRLVKNLRPQLAGKSDAEQDSLWKRELLACFTALKTARFVDSLAEQSDDLRA